MNSLKSDIQKTKSPKKDDYGQIEKKSVLYYNSRHKGQKQNFSLDVAKSNIGCYNQFQKITLKNFKAPKSKV